MIKQIAIGSQRTKIRNFQLEDEEKSFTIYLFQYSTIYFFFFILFQYSTIIVVKSEEKACKLFAGGEENKR